HTRSKRDWSSDVCSSDLIKFFNFFFYFRINCRIIYFRISFRPIWPYSIIYFSLFGSVIPLILIPISDSFYLILFLRFIQGFAIAGLPSTALAYISEEIDYKHAKIAVGFYISSNAVGGMLGRVISGYLTDIYSWQTTFYIIGIIGFIIALIVFII